MAVTTPFTTHVQTELHTASRCQRKYKSSARVLRNWRQTVLQPRYRTTWVPRLGDVSVSDPSAQRAQSANVPMAWVAAPHTLSALVLRQTFFFFMLRIRWSNLWQLAQRHWSSSRVVLWPSAISLM